MFLFILFLCWGSFLNVVAHRLLAGQSFLFGQSQCPRCHYYLAWYDLIPLISWFMLSGHCRSCHKPISLLYPTIELLTAILLTLLYAHAPFIYFPAYALFFSALIVTIRSDLETMLISRFVTLFLIPVGLIASACGFLPISLLDSITGTILGGGFLWLAATLFSRVRGIEGIGQGDIDLLAFIGSFLGFVGCWLTLCIGSIAGAIIGMFYILLSRSYQQSARIPFGPFLAAGAIIVVFLRDHLVAYLLLRS